MLGQKGVAGGEGGCSFVMDVNGLEGRKEGKRRKEEEEEEEDEGSSRKERGQGEVRASQQSGESGESGAWTRRVELFSQHAVQEAVLCASSLHRIHIDYSLRPCRLLERWPGRPPQLVCVDAFQAQSAGGREGTRRGGEGRKAMSRRTDTGACDTAAGWKAAIAVQAILGHAR